jgi:hypothetical protein
MKKKNLTCGCDMASPEFCKVCPQGKKINPDNIFVILQWSWKRKFGDLRREN